MMIWFAMEDFQKKVVTAFAVLTIFFTAMILLAVGLSLPAPISNFAFLPWGAMLVWMFWNIKKIPDWAWAVWVKFKHESD